MTERTKSILVRLGYLRSDERKEYLSKFNDEDLQSCLNYFTRPQSPNVKWIATGQDIHKAINEEFKRRKRNEKIESII